LIHTANRFTATSFFTVGPSKLRVQNSVFEELTLMTVLLIAMFQCSS